MTLIDGAHQLQPPLNRSWGRLIRYASRSLADVGVQSNGSGNGNVNGHGLIDCSTNTPHAHNGKGYGYVYGEPVDPDIDIGAALFLAPLSSHKSNKSSKSTTSLHPIKPVKSIKSLLCDCATPLQGVQVWVWEFDGGVPWCGGRRTGKVDIVYPGQLLTPIPPEKCVPIRCIGLNYKDHAAELKLPYPPYPEIFLLPPTTLAPPGGKILVPRICQVFIPDRLASPISKDSNGNAWNGENVEHDTRSPISEVGVEVEVEAEVELGQAQVDYEVELAFVLSRDARNVSEDEAMDYVLGFTGANDVTDRRWQGKGIQWSLCKGFDTFLPLGPCLVAPSDRLDIDAADDMLEPIPDILHSPKYAKSSKSQSPTFKLETLLNGEKMQQGCTSRMIWTIPQLIAHMSRGTTLPAGTIVITGTPPGIGASKTPQRWMKDGDEVRCVLSEGVGSLVSTVVYE